MNQFPTKSEASARPPRVDVAGIRREQIVEAAAAIIAGEGIQKLSLSAIEARTGLARGQLTYYFKAKEDILLAVFDRMVRRMCERVGDHPCHGDGWPSEGDAWGLIQRLLTMVLGDRPPPHDFTSLQYTFLAQVRHRDDFRERLASLYEQWRSHLAADLGALGLPPAKARTVASLVQAVVHGIIVQLEADPAAFDRTAMRELCLTLIGTILGRNGQVSGVRGQESERHPSSLSDS